MSRHLERELTRLKHKMLALGKVVQENFERSLRAVETLDARLAEGVIALDDGIDETEVEIEEECLKLLALYQPVAIDLRFIVAVLKINNDLERIGDLAVNISWQAIALAKVPQIRSVLPDFDEIIPKVKDMLRDCMTALIELDVTLAMNVCAADDEIDLLCQGLFQTIRTHMQQSPEHLNLLMKLFIVCRSLERVADHATNIAEDIIYMMEGEIVRHRDGRMAADRH